MYRYVFAFWGLNPGSHAWYTDTLLLVFMPCIWGRALLCGSGWPHICCVTQAGLEINSLLPHTSQVAGITGVHKPHQAVVFASLLVFLFFYFYFLELNSHYDAQGSHLLLCLSNPPASAFHAAGTAGVHHHTRLTIIYRRFLQPK